VGTELLIELRNAVKPFYLWAQPYCDLAAETLDLIQNELQYPGVARLVRYIKYHAHLLGPKYEIPHSYKSMRRLSHFI
jgi:hypothetical protein